MPSAKWIKWAKKGAEKHDGEDNNVMITMMLNKRLKDTLLPKVQGNEKDAATNGRNNHDKCNNNDEGESGDYHLTTIMSMIMMMRIMYR
ncbi:hypothetical protein HPP92_011172 [Vanilla planifolia]|uniref:Uncharacterized protein n=1 Tax=Vanilla planifolia TaxID=51239 RepID=A0A835R1C8_VANPL|nr:hypothetical protein HPP92_011172 [Vanilla planifolia]